jgi:hypothetical protein
VRQQPGQSTISREVMRGQWLMLFGVPSAVIAVGCVLWGMAVLVGSWGSLGVCGGAVRWSTLGVTVAFVVRMGEGCTATGVIAVFPQAATRRLTTSMRVCFRDTEANASIGFSFLV